MSYIQSFASGVCARHQKAAVLVNDVPTCLACVAPQPQGDGPVVLDEVPVDFDPIKAAEDDAKGKSQVARPQRAVTVATSASFDECVKRAVSVLQTCPMPKDLKQFKTVQKAIENLNKVVNPNG